MGDVGHAVVVLAALSHRVSRVIDSIPLSAQGLSLRAMPYAPGLAQFPSLAPPAPAAIFCAHLLPQRRRLLQDRQLPCPGETSIDFPWPISGLVGVSAFVQTIALGLTCKLPDHLL